jgi:hypothetical protein
MTFLRGIINFLFCFLIEGLCLQIVIGSVGFLIHVLNPGERNTCDILSL